MSTDLSAGGPARRLATRLVFFVAGFALACWAPLVPFAKARTGADERMLGLLLLCLGVGSLVAMPLGGVASARRGVAPTILVSGAVLGAILPFLALASTPLALGAALFFFGAALGALDVAVNVHGVEVERAAGAPLMSGFHAMFSLGGVAGAGLVTGLLSLGIPALGCALAGAAATFVALAVARPRLLSGAGASDGPALALPRGRVAALAALCALLFLTEGAVLDWSALLVVGAGHVEASRGGLAYLLFALAMTFGRLTGDRVVARLGDARAFFWGAAVLVMGLVVALAAPRGPALAGYALIGLGAANLVPILVRRAGARTDMPAALAVAAVTTCGYAGLLAGPALIGAAAGAFGLPTAFWALTALVAATPFCAGLFAQDRPGA
jgi:predicted MFS family arabinose efflux permease